MTFSIIILDRKIQFRITRRSFSEEISDLVVGAQSNQNGQYLRRVETISNAYSENPYLIFRHFFGQFNIIWSFIKRTFQIFLDNESLSWMSSLHLNSTGT